MKYKQIMYKSLLIGLILNITFFSYAQKASKGMEVKQNNFTSFRQNSENNKHISAWKKLNLPVYYNHPEFGKLPFNAPCTECVEILDRRTGDYRYFIDANDHQKFYVQKSIGDINYLESNYWVAKDVALQPVTSTIFESRKSAQKVGIDVQNKRSYIETSAGKVYFNQWKLIGLNGSIETALADANWSDFTIGDDGVKISNVFPNIDAQLMVLNGAVKTNFIIKQNNFGQYDKLVFRDEMNANQSVSLSFKNSNDLVSAGDMNVHIGNQALLEIAEGFAFPLNGDKDKAIVLNYTHNANVLDVIVPLDWITINIASGPLVVDPLVTGTATLAQTAITGSRYNILCNFDNSCDYPLTIPTPPQATFTDVRFSFAYVTSGICWLEDGAMKFQIGSCLSPSGATTFFFCNDIFGGTCTGTDVSIFPEVSSCLPAPSCVSQNVVMTLKFYRACYGSTGCSNDCIGANSPYIGVIEGKTLEFVNAVAPITLAATVCQGQSLNASTAATAGVGPFTYNWSFNASGTPSLGTNTTQSITFPTAGSQTVHLSVTDACGNVVNSSKVVNVTASPTATATSTSPVCVGSPINLTGTAVPAATSYSWTGPGGYTSTAQNPTIASATLANAGTYSLIVTNGGCPSPAATTVVVVNPLPISAPTSNSPVCLGGNLNLSGNTLPGTTTYSWTGPGGFTSTSQNPTITPMTAGTAGTYTLTVTNGGCTSLPVNVTVAVGPSPTAIPTSNSPICTGDNLTLTSNTVAGATYAWSGPNGFTSTVQNPTITAVTAADAGVYTLVIDNGGCFSAPSTTTVVVNPVPTATPSSNSPVCVGGTLNLSGNTVAGTTTYSWTGPNGFTSTLQNPSIPSVTATAAGTYTLTITNGGCSSTAATLNVIINPSPTATTSYNVGVCSGGSLNLTSNLVPGGTYAWTGPNGFTSSLQNPIINPVTLAAGGTYNLTITTSGCTPATSSVNVIVNPGPTATATTNAPICAGSTLNLNANTVTNATYGWTGPNGFTSTLQNPTIPAATSAASGIYILTITTPGCSPVTSSVNVTVTNNPTAIASSNAPICIGATLNLTAVAVAGATYAWTGPNSFTSTLQNPSIPNTTALNTGTYSLTVTIGTCQSAVSTTSVSFHPSPIVNVTKTDVLCNGGSTGTATATPTVAGTYTYVWSPSGGTGQTASNLPIGVYTVVTTNSNGCTASNTITINAPTVISLITNSTQSACGMNTGTANVVATGGSGAYTYAWSPTGGNGPTASNLAVGSYSVTVTDGNGCSKVANVNVASANPPVITVTNVTNITCFGLSTGSATIAVNGGSPGYTYNWLPTGGNGPTASNLTAGQYTVTVTDNVGCTATEIINITSPAELVVTTSGAGANCGFQDGTATANVIGGTGTYTYLWTPGNLTTQTISNLPPDTYNVVVTDGNGCSAANFYSVDQIGGLNIQVNPVTAVIYEGESVNLNATLDPYVPGLIYSWSPSNGLTCIDCPNPTATPDTTTIYTITIITPDGCADSVTSTIITKVNCGEYFIPTIFSPNGDGKNDVFKVYGKCIVALDMKIFNRWGEKVFESLDQEYGWDGIFKGETITPDSYYYSVKISFQDGTFANEKGAINVVK